MKVKAIDFYVYRWSLGDCTNGGASGKYDTLYVECPGGYDELDESDERLFKIDTTAFGNPILVPKNKPSGVIGPMAGGNYGASSDSRFSRAVKLATGCDFYGALPIHDRFETQQTYDMLSR